jgi:hypothetical protein
LLTLYVCIAPRWHHTYFVIPGANEPGYMKPRGHRRRAGGFSDRTRRFSPLRSTLSVAFNDTAVFRATDLWSEAVQRLSNNRSVRQRLSIATSTLSNVPQLLRRN